MHDSHCGSLGIAGQCFEHRAEQHLVEPTPDRAEHRAEQHRGIRRQQKGQNPHPGEPRRRNQLRKNRPAPIAELVAEFSSQKVHDHLNSEIERDQKTDFPNGNSELPLKREKQQRCKIIGDCARNVGNINGFHRMAKGQSTQERFPPSSAAAGSAGAILCFCHFPL